MERVRVLADRDASRSTTCSFACTISMVGAAGRRVRSASASPTARSAARSSTPATQASRCKSRPSRRAEARWFAVDDGALSRCARRAAQLRPAHARLLPARRATKRARRGPSRTRSSSSHETGITCTEPVYRRQGRAARGAHRRLRCRRAVELRRAARARRGAHGRLHAATARSSRIPAATKLALHATDSCCAHDDLHDPALDALFAAQHATPTQLRFARARRDRRRVPRLGRADRRQARRRRGPARLVRRDARPDERRCSARRSELERSSIDRQRRARSRSRSVSRSCSRGTSCACAARSPRRAQQARTRRGARPRARQLPARRAARRRRHGRGVARRAPAARALGRDQADPRRGAARSGRPSREIRERFRREAQTLASMKSRHTIALFDYGVTDDGVFYYVMELLDGLDLESLDRSLRRAAGRARDPHHDPGVLSRSPRRTRPACSTATSSRRTCSCAAPPTRSTSSSCSTSASSRRSTRPASSRRRGRSPRAARSRRRS